MIKSGASVGFMKVVKAFIKHFEALQRSVKIKYRLIFVLIQLSEMHGAGIALSYFTLKFSCFADISRQISL